MGEHSVLPLPPLPPILSERSGFPSASSRRITGWHDAICRGKVPQAFPLDFRCSFLSFSSYYVLSLRVRLHSFLLDVAAARGTRQRSAALPDADADGTPAVRRAPLRLDGKALVCLLLTCALLACFSDLFSEGLNGVSR